MELILDCSLAPADLHDLLVETLQFPAWYGKNLDALYDCLTDLNQPVTITVLYSDRYPGLSSVLEDSMAENPNLTVYFE